MARSEGTDAGAALTPEAERAALDAAVAAVLAGEAIPVLADRIGSQASAARPGHLVVVAGRSGPGRVYGRDIGLPRRAVLALDRVATGGGPGPPPRLGAAVRARGDVAPWAEVTAELTAAGLGLPLLVALAEGGAPLGVLALFPVGPGPDPAPPGDAEADAHDLALTPWVTVAALALAREADRARLRRSTVEDGVTGLPTRSLLTARLREALHRAGRRPVALVQVTLSRLDRLDRLVDAAEVDRTEELMREAAHRMRAVVRPGDVVGHLRADALGAICEGAGPDEAGEIGERVRRALATPVTVGDHSHAPTPGVGVVVATDADTVNSMVTKADLAAREAAERGGASVVRYRPGTYEDALARQDTETDLRRALADRSLHLVYQPQVALADGRLVGVEALVRWDHPVRGAVEPDEFIPVAEESGLVVALGAWAVDTALADIAAGLPVVVSVNLSARQLDEPSLIDEVTASLRRHRVDPARLRLEITESALARDADRSASLLRSLRRIGVRVSIDDFGTGYASLEQLRQTEVADSLKIDRTFVAGIVADARDRAIVSAAVTLGRSLGFSVVAEGVEEAAQADILREMGCDAAQGYWFGEPVRLEQLDLSRSV
ncbi:GGDEF domain-containing protein [Iamia sp. SCSIO 61187]|uniref:putative bifunctional diguanylate cyclase/phosphodiesterase n=1 Tax=Iamia sp. SCSIO 61187 TaxID=2722752 RepID=UPI001C63560A|nr:phosphodiesterase [Iamia sp. SCSIO 61187]QYG94831.1 GGDEF domain-containing protein [Iamia sp. SCSIO 61187]